jgi:hypothetical protein
MNSRFFLKNILLDKRFKIPFLSRLKEKWLDDIEQKGRKTATRFHEVLATAIEVLLMALSSFR